MTKNAHDYLTPEAYYKDRAIYGIQAPFLDMDGRIIFTKSEEEKKICTFLSLNDISFRYEQPYPIRTANEEKRQYYPDFTIYFNLGGQQYFLILEHFGIDKNGNVPKWFGVGQTGGFNGANIRYNAGIKWKRSFNQQNRTVLIETTSAMFQDGTIFEKLTEQLRRHDVPMRELTQDEIFEKLVKRNKKMEDTVLQLITTFIALMKSNRTTPDAIFETIKKENKDRPEFIERSRFMLYEIFKPMYEEYQEELAEKQQIDYTDLILKATDICESGLYKKVYDMILVDEFQDISVDRFRLIQSLRRKSPLTKLYCVGDDWQSIFRFSGSDLTLFNSFEEYFGYTERCKIETTYRFGNPVIKLSSAFILKNDTQVPKEVHPFDDSIVTKISLEEYGKDNETQLALLKKIVSKVSPSESLMLMGRYHSDIDFVPKNCVVGYDSKRNVSKVNICGRTISYRTVHSAKGLEADNVILVNCSQDGNGFPSRVCDDPILGYLLSKPESYPFGEERRLFYVAITRAKKHTYIMYKETCPSPFVTEMRQLINCGEIGKKMECPWCKNGNLRVIKESQNDKGQSRRRFYKCTNNTAGCQYTWFVNYTDERTIESKFELLVQQYKLQISADKLDELKKENPNADIIVTPAIPKPLYRSINNNISNVYHENVLPL